MFLSYLGRHPDQDVSAEPASVGQELSKMTVIRLLQLILDQDAGTRGNVSAEEISREQPGRNLPLHVDINLEPECLAEQIDVLPEPRSEFVRFARPYLARIASLKGS